MHQGEQKSVTFLYLVVVEQDSDPGFDRGHDVVEQVFLHSCTTVVGQVTYMDGKPDGGISQVIAVVIVFFRLLQKVEHRMQ